MRVEDYDASRHLPGLVELVQAVAATGGAVGWLSVPPPEEVQAWVERESPHVLLVGVDGGRVLGCGVLRRHAPVVLRGMGEVGKVMTAPDARGRGVARALVGELVDRARAVGLELLTLDCRGNNHAAQRLYASLGFVVTGRRPDAIAVGDERFDQVLMHLDLRSGPDGLQRHGSRCEGPGST